MLPVGGSRLFVRELGAGLPIVVLHGGPDFDHEYLAPELEVLADRFRVVFYDQRGRGRSFSGEGPPDVTLAGEMDDLDRVRAWTGAESVALLGHSWGGLLAMEYAIRHPDRVSHLILVNMAPASHRDAVKVRLALQARRTPEQSARMAELRVDPVFQAGDIDADAAFYRIYFGTTVRPDLLDAVVRRLRIGFAPDGVVAARAIEESLYEQTLSADDYDLIPKLGALRLPTLVIWGENDFIRADGIRRIADAIRGARLVELAGAGHFTFIEEPDRVRSIIAEFLAPS